MILKYPVETYIQITQNFKAGTHNGLDLGHCSKARWDDNNLVHNKKLAFDGVNHWIISPADGKVTGIVNNYATQDKSGNSYGNYVRIDHGGGIVTLHAHLVKGSVCVKVGDTVKQGQRIGRMGTTGRSNGVHLHTEVRVNGTRKDPQQYYYAFEEQALGTSIISGQDKILYYAPIVPVERDTSKNQLKTLKYLNVRTGAGTNYSIVGQANTGSIFNYYESKENGGYTWYRIEENQWIAQDKDNTYLEILPAETKDYKELYEEELAKNQKLELLNKDLQAQLELSNQKLADIKAIVNS